eukprot:TRINITY_DN15873_c0_g1_i1.p1 TRINITY_DN15873_c0_g1~~TRINITY_DN15873_c0_g1_i1.p1  ORF type:complete len:133 (-),score=21.44 TRINITY_DN15873_c0_g1_i1:60-401(-)
MCIRDSGRIYPYSNEFGVFQRIINMGKMAAKLDGDEPRMFGPYTNHEKSRRMIVSIVRRLAINDESFGFVGLDMHLDDLTDPFSEESFIIQGLNMNSIPIFDNGVIGLSLIHI